MKWLAASLLVLAACGLAPSASAASASFMSAFSGSSFDAIGVTPFDPALGMLDSVQVSIDGTLTVSGVAPSQVVVIGSVPTPIPYAYQIAVEQDFFGFMGKYFDFGGNALFGFSGEATGAATPFIFATHFAYDFSFTAATDLAQFTLPVFSTTSGTLVPPPTGIWGTRSDFLETFVPIDEIDLVQSWSSQTLGGPFPPSLQIGSVQAGGTINLLYNYTAPIPEPETYALLLAGIGLLGFAGAGRRRSIPRRAGGPARLGTN